MKILIPTFAFGREGGFRVLSELATAWVRLGATVDFLVPEESGPPYFPTSASVLRVSVDGSLSRVPAVAAGIINGGEGLLSLRKGLKSLALGYDVLLLNQCFTPWAACAIGRASWRKFYYIQAYEPEFYNFFKQPLHWMLAKASYYLPIKQIVNSPLYLNYKGIQAVDWVPPGLDLKVFEMKSSMKDFNSAPEIYIGCLGRREASKGTIYALQAFEELFQLDRRFKLRVAFGNLPEGWSHPGVEVVQIDSDADLSAFYRSLDILVAPGTIQHGAAHYPVLEGMASGVPVVTTGYLPANQQNSWLVDNKSASAIKEAVLAIVSDDNYVVRVKAARDAIEQFGWDEVAQKMLDVFRR